MVNIGRRHCFPNCGFHTAIVDIMNKRNFSVILALGVLLHRCVNNPLTLFHFFVSLS